MGVFLCVCALYLVLFCTICMSYGYVCMYVYVRLCMYVGM